MKNNNDFNHIYNEDCIEGMQNISSSSIDLVITDPPFAIEFQPHRANYNRTHSNVMAGYNEIKASEYEEFTIQWLTEATRLLKDTGSMFIFSGWNNLKDILNAIDCLGLTTVNHIIWKYQFGVVCKRKFVTSHYHCLYICKDDSKRKFFNSARYSKDERDSQGRSLRYKDLEDVWYIKREYWHGEQKTPTKLPREVIEKILLYASEEGDVILDPFLGSGQVAVVSNMLSRKYIGFEIVEEYFRFAKKRLDSGKYRLQKNKDKDKSSKHISLFSEVR